MTTESIPIYGLLQPANGPDPGLGYVAMMSGRKRPKFVALETREILAQNVLRLMDREFMTGDKYARLARRIGTSKSTIQRITNAEVGVTVDILTQIARGLRCEPADLLRPIE